MKSNEDEMVQRIKSELRPYLNGIQGLDINSRRYKLFRVAYEEFRERDEQTREIWSYPMKGLFTKTHTVKDSIQWMFSYLGLVEILGTALADILIMLLVANGIDFHIDSSWKSPNIKHALTLKDLEGKYVPLGLKLSFLRENGILTLCSIIDTKTRNQIAHMKFQVKDRQVLIEGKPVEQSLLAMSTELLHASKVITDLLYSKGVKRTARSKQSAR
jgi:hypothetical protein